MHTHVRAQHEHSRSVAPGCTGQPSLMMVLTCPEELTTRSDCTDLTERTDVLMQDTGGEAEAVVGGGAAAVARAEATATATVTASARIVCFGCGQPLRWRSLSACLRKGCSMHTYVASLQQEDVPVGPYARRLQSQRREGSARGAKRGRGGAGGAGASQPAGGEDEEVVAKKPYAQVGKRKLAMQLENITTDERGIKHWSFKGSKKQEYPETPEVYDRKVEIERLLFGDIADGDADANGAEGIETAWEKRIMLEAELYWLRAGYKHASHTLGRRSESLVKDKYLKKLERALLGASYKKRTGGDNSFVTHGPLVQTRDELFSDALLPQSQPPAHGRVWETLAKTSLSRSDIQDYISMIKAFQTCVPQSSNGLLEERTCTRPRPSHTVEPEPEPEPEPELEPEPETNGDDNNDTDTGLGLPALTAQPVSVPVHAAATNVEGNKKKKKEKKEKKEKEAPQMPQLPPLPPLVCVPPDS